MKSAFSRFSLSLCVLALMVGCGSKPKGPKLETVTGTVTFEGEPVKEGDITLLPVGPNGKSAGGKIVDGTFKVEVDAGKKKVEITALRDVPGKFKEDNPGEKMQVREQFIPEKYNVKSELEVDVTAEGKNDHKLELKKA